MTTDTIDPKTCPLNLDKIPPRFLEITADQLTALAKSADTADRRDVTTALIGITGISPVKIVNLSIDDKVMIIMRAVNEARGETPKEAASTKTASRGASKAASPSASKASTRTGDGETGPATAGNAELLAKVAALTETVESLTKLVEQALQFGLETHYMMRLYMQREPDLDAAITDPVLMDTMHGQLVCAGNE